MILVNSKKSLEENFASINLYILKDWSSQGYNHLIHSVLLRPFLALALVRICFCLLRLLLLQERCTSHIPTGKKYWSRSAHHQPVQTRFVLHWLQKCVGNICIIWA